MESYQTWFGEGPELAVLCMLGLFDRPADEKALHSADRVSEALEARKTRSPRRCDPTCFAYYPGSEARENLTSAWLVGFSDRRSQMLANWPAHQLVRRRLNTTKRAPENIAAPRSTQAGSVSTHASTMFRKVSACNPADSPPLSQQFPMTTHVWC
jgi:hypothetical protein